jgi:hypothetical protein
VAEGHGTLIKMPSRRTKGAKIMDSVASQTGQPGKGGGLVGPVYLERVVKRLRMQCDELISILSTHMKCYLKNNPIKMSKRSDYFDREQTCLHFQRFHYLTKAMTNFVISQAYKIH